jgi:hypothetical protein
MCWCGMGLAMHFYISSPSMTKLTICLPACLAILCNITDLQPVMATESISNSYNTAKVIELDRVQEGTLPVSQGRQCFQVNVPEGKRVSIRGSNDHGTVFFSAYTSRGQVLIGETQVLASFQPYGVVETEENDGSVMVCIDSDTAQRRTAHRYSLQVSLAGSKPTLIASAASLRGLGKPVEKAEKQPAQIYPQPKFRQPESGKQQSSPFVDSPLQLAANSRSFVLNRDGGSPGDAGNNAKTAHEAVPNQMYSGYLNASLNDDRDCYNYPDLPVNSKLQVAVANNSGILGISAYSEAGKILIGQAYMINQQTQLETEATSGNVMVCLDTDGEKTDHQYTFEAQIKQ